MESVSRRYRGFAVRVDGFSLCLGFCLCDRGTRRSPPWAHRRAARRVRWLTWRVLLTQADRVCLGKFTRLPDKRAYMTNTSLFGDNLFIAQIRLSTSYPEILGVSDFPGLTNEQSTFYPESRSDLSNRAPRLRASSSLTLSASWDQQRPLQCLVWLPVNARLRHNSRLELSRRGKSRPHELADPGRGHVVLLAGLSVSLRRSHPPEYPAWDSTHRETRQTRVNATLGCAWNMTYCLRIGQ